MSTDDTVGDEIIFLPEDEGENVGSKNNPWLILVVDDDLDMHIGTSLLLGSLVVYGRPFTSISAYSGKEASEILASRDDIDLVFLDCVMENPDSGFEVAHFLKNILHKTIPVIIMRSGFAGRGIEKNLEDHPEVDAFVEKGNATAQVIVNLLHKWLPKN